MKKRILVYTVALWLFSATFAFAGTIVSYNPSFGHSIRTVLQWVIGNQRLKTFTTDSCDNGQKKFTAWSVWLNHFTGEITVVMDRSVVTGTCP